MIVKINLDHNLWLLYHSHTYGYVRGERGECGVLGDGEHYVFFAKSFKICLGMGVVGLDSYAVYLPNLSKFSGGPLGSYVIFLTNVSNFSGRARGQYLPDLLVTLSEFSSPFLEGGLQNMSA